MKKSAFLRPLSPRKSGISCDSSWSTFHTVSCPTGSGKVKSKFFESEVRRILLPFS